MYHPIISAVSDIPKDNVLVLCSTKFIYFHQIRVLRYIQWRNPGWAGQERSWGKLVQSRGNKRLKERGKEERKEGQEWGKEGKHRAYAKV